MEIKAGKASEARKASELVKSVYLPPLLTKIAEIELEHPLLSASIIPDKKEVEILPQPIGQSEDFTTKGWD